MILQTDIRLKKAVNDAGCYLMCILYFVNKYTGFRLSTVVINNLYLRLQEVKGRYNDYCLGSNCFVQDADKIFNHLDFNVTYTGVHEEANYICKPNEIEILCLKHKHKELYHFVCGDGRGHETYNPMGTSSDNYVLLSKRIFIMHKGR